MGEWRKVTVTVRKLSCDLFLGHLPYAKRQQRGAS